MRAVSAEEIDSVLTPAAVADALAEAFAGGVTVPDRHHHDMPRPGAADATLLLMPAWHDATDGFIGVKVVSVFPDNASRGAPSVVGGYLLLSGATGVPLAFLDGTRLTLWRTAAASALAARHLARKDARRLVMVGAGALARFLIPAHAAARPIDEVLVWSRSVASAERLAAELDRPGLGVRPVTDLAAAVAEADIVSCATLATEPLIAGEWLRPGVHVDLVGAFKPTMREADVAVLARARVFVDTPKAFEEAGEIVHALAAGALTREAIAEDLFGLCRGGEGRRSDGEITLFKSVGTALEDLAAAALVWRRLTG